MHGRVEERSAAMEDQEKVQPEAKRRKSLSLKKWKLSVEEGFIVVSLKVVKKKDSYLTTPEGVLNGWFITFMPGDDRGMSVYLMICVVTRYCSLKITDPSVTGCELFVIKQRRKIGIPTLCGLLSRFLKEFSGVDLL